MAAPKTSINPKARPRTKTEEKTLRGRPVWIDHTGEVTGEKGAKYSEVTTTIPWGTEWITAPSVDENGKKLSDDEVKQRLLETRGKDFITGEELPTFSNPEKASEYAQWRSDTMFDQEAIEQGFPEEFPMGPEPERKDFIDRSLDKGKDFLEYLTAPSKHGVFNKGGAVMNEQMEMAFMQQGGLKDDGMKRDPVSGNEVPNGSMAKEVRDDIPAQLSEGEYVVPADVVRYLGVKHFEDLRNKAKSGLQNMEANGRIGGEPVPVGGPKAAPMPQPPTPYMAEGGDLTPDEMNEIKMLMNQGGMVAGAAEGTDFGQKFMTQPSVYGGGFSFEDTPGGTPSGVSIADPELPTEAKTLYGPGGEVVTLTLPKDQQKYDELIAQGYTETQPVSKFNDDSDGAPSPTVESTSWYENTDWTDASKSADKYFGTGATFSSGLTGAVAGAVAGLPGMVAGKYGAQVSNLATARAEVEIRKAIGDTAGAEILQKAIDTQLKSSSGLGLADKAIDSLFGSDGDMKLIKGLQAAGIEVDASLRDDDLDDFMKNLNEGNRNKLITKYGTDTAKPPVTPAAAGKAEKAATPSSYDTTTKEQIQQRQSDRSERSSQITAGQKIAGQNLSGKSDQYKTEAVKQATKGTTEEERKGGAELDASMGISGLNKGGLMKKKRKK